MRIAKYLLKNDPNPWVGVVEEETIRALGHGEGFLSEVLGSADVEGKIAALLDRQATSLRWRRYGFWRPWTSKKSGERG